MPDIEDVTGEVVAPTIEQPDVKQEPVEDSQEKNWKAVRQTIAEQKEAIARQNHQIEEMKRSMEPKVVPIVEEDMWDGLDDNDLIEVSKAKHLFPKMVAQETKKALEAARREQMSSPDYLEQKCRGKHADFDEVVNQEHIDEFIKTKPSIHAAILKADDPIEAAYEYITSTAAYVNKKTNTSQHLLEKAKMEQNAKKPKSANSAIPTSSVTSAGGFSRLTKDQQKQLWIEHQRKLGRSA